MLQFLPLSLLLSHLSLSFASGLDTAAHEHRLRWIGSCVSISGPDAPSDSAGQVRFGRELCSTIEAGQLVALLSKRAHSCAALPVVTSDMLSDSKPVSCNTKPVLMMRFALFPTVGLVFQVAMFLCNHMFCLEAYLACRQLSHRGASPRDCCTQLPTRTYQTCQELRMHIALCTLHQQSPNTSHTS